MEPQIALAVIAIASSFLTSGYLLITKVLEAKRKEDDYQRTQRVNKDDWISWLNEAKREIEALKKEMKDLVDKHREELRDKDALISRLQKQVNEQAHKIYDLEVELRQWKDKYSERKEEIKDEVKGDLPEFLIKP